MDIESALHLKCKESGMDRTVVDLVEAHILFQWRTARTLSYPERRIRCGVSRFVVAEALYKKKPCKKDRGIKNVP